MNHELYVHPRKHSVQGVQHVKTVLLLEWTGVVKKVVKPETNSVLDIGCYV